MMLVRLCEPRSAVLQRSSAGSLDWPRHATRITVQPRSVGLWIGLQCIIATIVVTQAPAGYSGGDPRSESQRGTQTAEASNIGIVAAGNKTAALDQKTAATKKKKRRPDTRTRKSPSPSAPLSPPSEISVTSPLLDAISQNTPGYSEGYALGVPRRFEWCSGSYKPAGYAGPPPDFTAVTGWGAVYPKAGAAAYSNPNAMIEIANAKTYVHLKSTREWILIQDQAKLQVVGAHFVADFKANAAIPMRSDVQPDGSLAIGTPPNGYNDHFWFTDRGTFTAGSVDGVYVLMEMRKTDPKVSVVANVGADWWRSATADYVDGFSNNPGAGMSNWVELSTQWSTLHFYSWTTSELRGNPPPPLVEAMAQNHPSFTRRLSSSSSYCAPRVRRTQ